MHVQGGRSVIALLVCLALTVVPQWLSAQRQPPLWPGSRLRVWHEDACCRSPQVGALISISPDSVLVRSERGADSVDVALPRSTIRLVEHSWVTRDYGRRGAGLGVVGGVAASVAVLAYLSRECEEACGTVYIAPYAIGGGALIGFFVGRVIGRSVHHEEWRRVSLPTRVGFAPDHHGAPALRLALRF